MWSFLHERGCVEDQQQVKGSESLENSKALRLVEHDTAVLRHFSNTLSDKAPCPRQTVADSSAPNSFFPLHD
jgi:hypothetical protein